MAQVYFHCSSAQGVFLDRCGNYVDGLRDACEHATQLVHTLISTPCSVDWRDWVLHVSDGEGEEIFALPFSQIVGKPH